MRICINDETRYREITNTENIHQLLAKNRKHTARRIKEMQTLKLSVINRFEIDDIITNISWTKLFHLKALIKLIKEKHI